MGTRQKNDLVTRAGSLGALLLLQRLVKTPKGQQVSRKVDRSVAALQKEAARTVKRATANAAKNRKLLSAGVAVVAVGLALIGRASWK